MEKGKVVAIVQARMGSTRLPGKSMIELQGKPLIAQVLRRCQRAKMLDDIVLATTENPRDEVLCRVAESLGVRFVQGSEHDVLARFLQAAITVDADIVVRVCADNPLIAPEEIDRIVKHHVHTGADYSFNQSPKWDNGYPDGLGAEVVNFDLLNDIGKKASEDKYREHATLYIWENQQQYKIESIQAPPEISGQDITLDIDTLEDLQKMEKLIRSAPCDIAEWTAEDIVANYRKLFG